MERDFMGLSSSFSNAAVKEEAIEECKESEFRRCYHEAAVSFRTTHPSLGSVAGTAKTRLSLKPSESPPQMTIFYGGIVNVFDNVSPEKGQAILFLAGNVSAKVAKPLPQGDGVGLFSPKLASTTPNSGHSIPITVFSHPIVQDSQSKDKAMPIKPVAILGTPITRTDSPKMCSSTTTILSAVPQARKVSLARFLEKRKERVMNSGPYNIGKISSEGFDSSIET